MEKVIVSEFKDYHSTVFNVLGELGFAGRLKNRKKIIIKPNLLQDTPPPCTTDVHCIEAITRFIQENNPDTKIMILEGSGGCSTKKAFRVLGYEALAEAYNLELLDVDDADTVLLKNPDALAYREIYLPKILFESYIISVPCLKDHSITGITLSFKNLIGLLPEKYYGKYWSYNRSDVHRVGVDKAILDLSNYINIDLCIIDGRIGQQGSHLAGGRHCNPYKNVILGGYDALEVDRKGAEIMGHKWQDIKHLRMIAEKK